MICAQQELRKKREVVFQGLLIEWHTRKLQEVVLKVIEIPGNGLLIEARTRVADAVIQIAARLDLKTREEFDRRAIRFDNRWRNALAGPVARKELKERCVPEVLFQVRPVL